MSLMDAGRKQRRGYMLIEALVAGVVFSIGMASVFGKLASFDRTVSEAQHRAQAQSALLDGFNRYRGRVYSSVANMGATSDTPPGLAANSRTITITTPAASACQMCKMVVVSVTYPLANGTNRTITQTSYISP